RNFFWHVLNFSRETRNVAISAPQGAEAVLWVRDDPDSTRAPRIHRRACSQRLRVEGVAGVDVAGLEAGLEPLYALRRGAVREGIGHHRALRFLLQRVV